MQPQAGTPKGGCGKAGAVTEPLDLLRVRVIVTDANALGRLDPEAVAAYLQRTGWVRAHERATGAIWTRWLDDSAVKVLVPNDPAVADFALRMGALLAALAVAEDRSQLAVLCDLCGAAADEPAGADLESLQRDNQRLRDQLDASASHTAEECEADAIQAEYEALQRRAEQLETALHSLVEAISDGDPATFELTPEDFLRLRRAVKQARAAQATASGEGER